MRGEKNAVKSGHLVLGQRTQAARTKMLSKCVELAWWIIDMRHASITKMILNKTKATGQLKWYERSL